MKELNEKIYYSKQKVKSRRIFASQYLPNGNSTVNLPRFHIYTPFSEGFDAKTEIIGFNLNYNLDSLKLYDIEYRYTKNEFEGGNGSSSPLIDGYSVRTFVLPPYDHIKKIFLLKTDMGNIGYIHKCEDIYNNSNNNLYYQYGIDLSTCVKDLLPVENQIMIQLSPEKILNRVGTNMNIVFPKIKILEFDFELKLGLEVEYQFGKPISGGDNWGGGAGFMRTPYLDLNIKYNLLNLDPNIQIRYKYEDYKQGNNYEYDHDSKFGLVYSINLNKTSTHERQSSAITVFNYSDVERFRHLNDFIKQIF